VKWNSPASLSLPGKATTLFVNLSGVESEEFEKFQCLCEKNLVCSIELHYLPRRH